jgi:hypothetical protein
MLRQQAVRRSTLNEIGRHLPLTVIAEETVEMARNVLCLLGRHHWVERTEGGETYTGCSRCGKYRPYRPGSSGQSVPDPPSGGPIGGI